MMEPTEKHLSVLKKYFGHNEFRPMQWKIVKSIIEDRRDNCVIMATGYGKSLCYQYPPVFCEGLAIVISPLISLMQDQVLSLKMRNIPACFLGTAQKEKSAVTEELLNGHYRLVYVTPELCTHDYGEGLLGQLITKNINITLIAIDEAHCVSQWGHDFRTSYRYLGKLRKILPNVPIVTLTATATPQVKADIISSLGLRNPQEVTTSVDRPNLFLSVSLKGSDLLLDIRGLVNRCKIENTFGPTIIYCPTKKVADKIFTTLRVAGFKCNMYHAGLSSKVRERAHEEFVKDVVEIIIATVAFGMGIDKPDVRLVIHYGAPKDIESYYQEIGRAGRDGLPSVCHTFYAQTDFTLNRSFLSSLSGNFKVHKEDMQRMMERYVQATDCRRKILVKHFNPNFKFDADRDLKSCCDNCVKISRSGSKPDIDYDLKDDAVLLLKAVREMSEKYGLYTYILLLRGSTNKRMPERYYTSKLYGAGREKTDPWWKLLGGLLLRESFLEEVVSNFGQGWNKNNFPVKIVKLTNKGRHYIETNGEIAHLEPTPEMLTMIHRMPRKTQDGWLESRKLPTELPEHQPDETSCLRDASLEDALFEELLKFRTDTAEKLHCMPYMILDNRSIQDLTVKRPKTLDELSSIEGITDAKIKKFGNECLECIAKVMKSHSAGNHSSKTVSAKRFMKNFAHTKAPQVMRYEEEAENDLKDQSSPYFNEECGAITDINKDEQNNTDCAFSEDLEKSFAEDIFDNDVLAIVDRIESGTSTKNSDSDFLSKIKPLNNLSERPPHEPESTSFKRKRDEFLNTNSMAHQSSDMKCLLKVNQEKKKISKKKVKLL